MIEQDLMYKAVTDSLTVRQWDLTDKKLIESLAKKNIALPDHFDASFVADLRAKKQKVFGAEILVIEAVKS